MILRGAIAARLPALAFRRGLMTAFALLTPREKSMAGLLLLSMNLNAGLNLAGLAGVVPFVQLMLDPMSLSGEGAIALALRRIGVSAFEDAILMVGAVLVLLVVVKNAYGLLHLYLTAKFSAGIETRLASEMLSGIVAAPYAWLVRRNASVLRDVVLGHVVEASRGVVRGTLQLVNDVIFLVLALSLLVVSNPLPAVVVAITTAVVALALMSLLRPRIARLAEQKRRSNRLAGVTATEAIAGGRDVRMSDIGPILLAAFRQDFGDYARADAASRQWQIVPRFGIEIIGFAALIAVAIVALHGGTDRATVAALLALYAVVAMRAIPVVSQVTTGINQIVAALPAVAELQDLRLSLRNTPPTLTPENREIGDWRSVELRDISVRYDDADVVALEGVSLVVERDRSLGIVGASGSGKSTLVDVLAGLLAPSSGTVLIDGRPLSTDDATSWRGRIAYVAQSPFLLDATIAENVRFGTPPERDEDARLASALKAAGLAAFVAQLPEREHSMAGERGARMSGGQRQRLAIARALYRRAELIILDEATSSLDSLTEREVADAIYALAGKTTLVIIAHRLSTIARCDKILVLDQGRALAQGTHATLLGSCPIYRLMVQAQSLASAEPSAPVDAQRSNS
jgi:ABC-type multidrug transport system fused ATPase/permease subunit